MRIVKVCRQPAPVLPVSGAVVRLTATELRTIAAALATMNRERMESGYRHHGFRAMGWIDETDVEAVPWKAVSRLSNEFADLVMGQKEDESSTRVRGDSPEDCSDPHCC